MQILQRKSKCGKSAENLHKHFLWKYFDVLWCTNCFAVQEGAHMFQTLRAQPLSKMFRHTPQAHAWDHCTAHDLLN